MVKLGFNPTASAWRRRIRAAIEWKVPSHSPSAAWPMSFSSRRRISAAALLVKVTATICDGQARRVARMWLSRAISTLVLPVPAPARTSTGPSTASAAMRWTSFRSAR